MSSRRQLNIIITAGPTQEPIDDIRFLSNYSTGTVGYKIADVAAKRGHKVILVSGPACRQAPYGIKTIFVDTAKNMQLIINKHFKWCNCLIMAAAVADYRPVRRSAGKIKKTKKQLSLRLIKNPDILKSLGRRKRRNLLIGFSLEKNKLIQHSKNKLKEKNLDLIVANRVTKDKKPFGDGIFDIYLIDRALRTERWSQINKSTLARRLLDKVEKLWYNIFEENKCKGEN